MKKLSIVFSVLIALLIASCDYHDHSPGIPGRDGNANVRSFTYTIYPGDWTRSNTEENKWYHEKINNLITPDIVDFGAVLVYLRSTTGNLAWVQLPLTEYYIDERNLLQVTEYLTWHSDNLISIIWYDSHDLEPLAPDWICNIKVIVIEDWPYYSIMLKDVDLKNSAEVEKALGINSENNDNPVE